MLNRIIKLALYNRIVTLILAAIALIAGCVVMMRSEIDIFPDLNSPTVVVMTETPGMAPDQVEKLVTYPIESRLSGASGIRHVRSSSAMGYSTVQVEFDWGTDYYKARQIVSERLQGVSSDLPAGVGNPTLGPESSILGEMMIIGLTSEGATDMTQLRTIADRDIAPRLRALSGVAQVSVIGGNVKQYQILVNPAAMKTFDVSAAEIADALEGVNDNVAAGITVANDNEYAVKTAIATIDVDDIAATVIRADEAGTVTVGDIAQVTVGTETPRIGTASVDTHPAVLITVTKQPGVGTITLTDNIVQALDKFTPSLPDDVSVRTDLFRQADFINSSVSNLQQSLLEGAFFVIIVLFVFLMNLRTTLVSVIALPMSIIITVIILNLLGITINTMSLGGIAIAVGSLVDDAIVDVENLYRRMRENSQLPPERRLPRLKVVYQASCEVRTPIFNSTLIIIAGFLPLFFLSGFEGRLLVPLGVSFIVALAASTIIALTLTPVLCSYMPDSGKSGNALSKEPPVSRKLKALYVKSLEAAMRHRRAVIVCVAVIFVITTALTFTLGRGFLPAFNEGSFTVNVSALPGLSLDQSDSIGRRAEQLILSVPEVTATARKTGRAELAEHSFGSNVSEIEAPYTLTDRSRAEVAAELRQKLSQLPGVNVEIGQPVSHRIDAMLSGTEAQIAIKLFGDNLPAMYQTGQKIKQVITPIEGVVDVNVEQQVERPQIDIRPRRAVMARYGVTPGQLGRDIEMALAGVDVGQVFEQGIPVALTLRYDLDRVGGIGGIRDLPVSTAKGTVPLSEIADVLSVSVPNTINREDVQRRLVISANVHDRDLRGAVDEIATKISEQVQLPEGVYITYGGQFESEAAASRTLLLTSLLALIIIFVLLRVEFKNNIQSLIILVNMPLALIGGALMLFFTGADLNIPAIIGFISLGGIATRGGMLLISRYNTLRDEGESLIQRIRHGSSDRLNAIIMTALTSALALIPIAVGVDEPGNEIQAPMALVILGGLISSTILNIYVVPLLYYWSQRNKTTEND